MITRRRALIAGIVLTIGLLQAWDSHAFAAGRLIAVMAIAAVVIPATAAIMATRAAIHWVAIVATALLAFGARMLSPIPLPELGLLVVIAAIALLGAMQWWP